MNGSGNGRWQVRQCFTLSSTGLRRGCRLSVGQKSGACRKERILTKVWLTSILFQLISGDKHFS